MPRKAAFALFLLACLVAARDVAAQSKTPAVEITSWPEGYVWLTDGWRAHGGDDPAYARPDFDDSSWRPVSLLNGNDDLSAMMDKGYGKVALGYQWYRFHLRVPQEHPPLAVWVGAESGLFQLYVNGKPAGHTEIVSHWRVRSTQPEVIPLPDDVRDFVFAVRTNMTPYLKALDEWSPTMTSFQVGTKSALDSSVGPSEIGGFYRRHGVSLAIDICLLFAALAALSLYFFQRGHVEYMWLGLYLGLLGGLDFALHMCQGWMWPIEINAIFCDPGEYILVLVQIEFTFVFAGQRVGRAWRVLEAVLVVTAVAAVPSNVMGGMSNNYFLYESLLFLIPAIGLPVLLVVWLRRGNREAGWLILPSLLPGATGAAVNLGYIFRYQWHFDKLGFLMDDFQAIGLSFQPATLGYFLFLLAIGLVMFLRFTRVSQAESRAATELDAARDMQRKLVPAELPMIAGCTIAASYVPAEEVGGDFYQVLPQADDSTLLVVGDVSGKGLKAAMTGTFALGCLRALAAANPSPAALLAGMNEEMVRAEQGGFITMICARIGADGAVTIANAGHLHPYHNGREVELEPGVPLGVVAGASYAETSFRLTPGDTLTFLSDGVVEAKKATGELFGFERTEAISGQPASRIAAAAQSFGQEDDITVVSLTRSGVAEPALA